MHWTVMYPAATSQLLGWLAKDREASIELAPAVLGCDVLDDSDVDSILLVAFPSLVGEVRAAASVRVGQLIGAEVDTSVIPPLVEWLWPTGTPFPPAATVEGVQARLNYFDLGAGPVTGVWNEQTGRAFRRWKVLNGFDPIEECDDEARESLGYRAPDAP